MKNRLIASFLSIVAVSLFTSGISFAEDNNEHKIPDYQIEFMNPATGVADYVDLVSPIVAGHLDFNAGGYLSFAKNPLLGGTPNGPGDKIVAYQVTLSALGSIGLFDFMELGLMLPVTLLQGGGDGFQYFPEQRTVDPNLKLKNFGVNDLRLNLKFMILDTFSYPVGLGVLVNATFPTGTKGTLTSDKGFSVEGLLLGEVRVYRNIRATLNVGFRWRQHDRTLLKNMMGSSVNWGIGVVVPLWFSTFDFLLEADGAVSIAKRSYNSISSGRFPGEYPAEIKLAARWGIMRHLTATFGIGAALNNKGVGAPLFRAFAGVDGRWVLTDRFNYNIDYDADNLKGDDDKCPELAEDFDGFQDEDGCPEYDNDGDGIDDDVDKCPNTPPGAAVDDNGCRQKDSDGDGIDDDVDKCPEDREDFDGFQDKDGCPEYDNDNDGYPDAQDKCPNKPEDFNGFRDEDGCPEGDKNSKVKISNGAITIDEQVYFETGNAVIQRRSYDILNQVAKVLRENPQIELMQIEGHTDNRGRARSNKRLSQKRAESVRQYLIEQGIDSSRIQAVGYGEDRPIASNKTEEGRQKNRRVEFKMLKVK